MTVLTPLIMSDAFSAIIMMGALVFPEMMVGMMEPSTTRRPWMPRTLQKEKLKSEIYTQYRRCQIQNGGKYASGLQL